MCADRRRRSRINERTFFPDASTTLDIPDARFARGYAVNAVQASVALKPSSSQIVVIFRYGCLKGRHSDDYFELKFHFGV